MVGEITPLPSRCTDGTSAPLTFQQEYWRRFAHPDALTRLDTSFALRLLGPLNIRLLRKSFEEIVARHGSLRTRIYLEDEPARQQVDRLCEFRLETVHGSPELASDLAKQTIDELSNLRRDLKVGPLFEAKLVRCSDREHVLVWGINHLVIDGWSLNLIFRELWLVYGEAIRGRPSPLRKLTVTFYDYLVWQQEAHRNWVQKHAPYWTRRLLGAAGIRWPGEDDVSRMNRGGSSRLAVSFPHALSKQLRNMSLAARTPLSLQLLTVYVAAISLCCHQHDFIVETLINGRDRLEHHPLVGFLAHPMYLRMQLSGGETCSDLLGLVRREYYRSLFRKDFGGLAIERPELLSGTYFNWLPWAPNELCGMPTAQESRRVELAGEMMPFDSGMNVADGFKIATILWDTNEGIRGCVHYGVGFFAAATIQRIVGVLESTAERFVEVPHARVV